MQSYAVIIGVLKLRQKNIPYSQVQSRYGIGSNATQLIVKRFEASGHTLEELQQMDPHAVEELFYPPENRRWKKEAPIPDFKAIHDRMVEMGKSADLVMIWMEYHHDNPNGYMLARFYQLYNKYCIEHYGAATRTKMPVERHPGENVYIDWAGKKPALVIGADGELLKCHIFVTTVGLSSELFAELFPDEKTEHFITGVVDALEAYGAVPKAFVPDNLKTAVTTHTKDKMELNAAFSDLESFYGVIVLPPPYYKPHGKPSVENGVKTVENQLVEELKKNAPYRSFREANEELKRIIDAQNASTIHRKLSRREIFEEFDKPAMKKFSDYGRFSTCDYKYVEHLPDNYHILYDDHYYSVPYQYVGKPMILKASGAEITISDINNQLVSKHMRSYKPFPKYITQDSHMPATHRYYKELGTRNGSYYKAWASHYGRYMTQMIGRILASAKHEEQMYNSCNSILHMCDGLGYGIVEEAARKCVENNCCRYSYFKKVLKEVKDKGIAPAPVLPENKNIRGKEEYK